jgi:hypothetical protein
VCTHALRHLQGALLDFCELGARDRRALRLILLAILHGLLEGWCADVELMTIDRD